MMEHPELTAKEKLHVGFYNDPARLFGRALDRALSLIIPSIGMMILWLITQQRVYAVVGYSILLCHSASQLVFAKRGIRTMSGVLAKYRGTLEHEQ